MTLYGYHPDRVVTRNRGGFARCISFSALARFAVGVVAVVVAVVGVAGAAGCADGDLGAVSVRWRIVDKTSARVIDPRGVGDPLVPGACACVPPSGDCPRCGFRITRVQLRVTNPSTGEPIPVDDRYTLFECTRTEATTGFRIPEGEHALSLRAFDPAEPDRPQATTPPPVVRQISRGEIVNLDVIELAVDPAPLASQVVDGGVASDATCQ
jgi:hypothetical protein